MGMIGMDLRARQQLALTPRLQQSVKLLQLSAMEFEQALQQAIGNGQTRSTAVATVMGDLGVPKRRVYDIATALPR